MFCSVIIPTIARPVLARAVESVLRQTFTEADFEVIVVNDSGRPLPEADWQHAERVTVIHTNRRERIFARNTGAAVAKGKYLNFLDDDDWLLPGALQSFWELAQRDQQAHWLYGGSQLVDRQGRPVIQLHHGMQGNCFVQVMAGEWIPLQSSLILSEAFFGVGGFTPLMLATEDTDLTRRIALHGNFEGTTAVVSCVGMGSEGSSSYYDLIPRYSRLGRERILNEPRAFSRLRASVHSAAWQGRMVRIYLTAVLWNLRHRKFFTAASRAIFGMAALALAGRHWFSSDFWQSIIHNYSSPTFLGDQQETSYLAQA